MLFSQIAKGQTISLCLSQKDSLVKLADEFYYTDALKSLEHSNKLLALAHQCKNNKVYIAAYQSLGWAYLALSNFPESIKHSEKALVISEKNKDTLEYIASCNLLGNVYLEIPDKDFALRYFLKGIEIAEKANDYENLSNLYNNIAIVYEQLDDIKTALNYYLKAKAFYEQGNNNRDKGLIYLNIGELYFQTEKYDSAFYYLTLSRTFLNTNEDRDFLANLYLALSSEYMRRGNYKIAALYIDSCYTMLGDGSSPTDFIAYYLKKANVYNKTGDFKEAFFALQNAYNLKDSILSKEIINKLRDAQIAAVTERKENEIQQLKQENEIQELKLSENKATQRTYLMGIVLVIALSVFLVIVVFNNSRNNKKLKTRNQIIENQSNDIISKNLQLEQVHKEILDSIHYAKRIQSAILPSHKAIKECLNDFFILYIPKDIVAGDFYWLEKKDDITLIAAADCTGHGVPGAMVSVICNNGLNRSVREHGITEPGKILDKTREIVIQEFEKSDDDVKDGMDISLCALQAYTENNNKTILHWAGANNPLWIIRNNSNKNNQSYIEVVKADKQPIGKHENARPFKTHEIILDKGDIIYIFTDGYQDQFGGENLDNDKTGGKKFKASRLKELLLRINDKSMEAQKNILIETFENWKGDIEQIDDVCIIGIRV